MNIEHVVIILSFIMAALVICTALNTILLVQIRWLFARLEVYQKMRNELKKEIAGIVYED